MAEAVAKKSSKIEKIKEYFRGVGIELKKVIWPTKNETYRYTLVVVVVCALFALLFWLLDTGFLFILEKVLSVAL